MDSVIEDEEQCGVSSNLAAALACGETYKTYPLVALFQLRADCGLRRPGGELALAPGELDAAADALATACAAGECLDEAAAAAADAEAIAEFHSQQALGEEARAAPK